MIDDLRRILDLKKTSCYLWSQINKNYFRNKEHNSEEKMTISKRVMIQARKNSGTSKKERNSTPPPFPCIQYVGLNYSFYWMSNLIIPHTWVIIELSSSILAPFPLIPRPSRALHPAIRRRNS